MSLTVEAAFTMAVSCEPILVVSRTLMWVNGMSRPGECLDSSTDLNFLNALLTTQPTCCRPTNSFEGGIFPRSQICCDQICVTVMSFLCNIKMGGCIYATMSDSGQPYFRSKTSGQKIVLLLQAESQATGFNLGLLTYAIINAAYRQRCLSVFKKASLSKRKRLNHTMMAKPSVCYRKWVKIVCRSRDTVGRSVNGPMSNCGHNYRRRLCD